MIERAVYCLMDGGGVEWNETVRRWNVVKAEIEWVLCLCAHLMQNGPYVRVNVEAQGSSYSVSV